MYITYHIILLSVKDDMIMNLWAWTILNKQCLVGDSWRHAEMSEQQQRYQSEVLSSVMGSLFASFLASFSWIKCVPCSSQHSMWLLQRDGLFKAAQVKNEMEYMTLGKSSLVETITLCAPSGGFLPPLNSTALISSFTQSHPAGVFLIQSIVSCQMPLACSRPPFRCWIMQPTSAWPSPRRPSTQKFHLSCTRSFLLMILIPT